jgi:hypothetical protein
MTENVCTDEVPWCWGGVIHGMDGCYCPGSPLDIAWERRDRAIERLNRMKARMPQRGTNVIDLIPRDNSWMRGGDWHPWRKPPNGAGPGPGTRVRIRRRAFTDARARAA